MLNTVVLFGFETYKKTRMHSSRMRTACSSDRPGGSLPGTPPGPDPPGDQTTPPGADTNPEHSTPSGSRLPPGLDPRGAGTPPVNRMTDACENITLPQLRCGR